MDYKKTLNLPRTDFSMKANLPRREPEMLKRWDKIDLYGLLRKATSGKEKFVLHDGPPYANGDIHMGHVLNKILKDIVVRYKTMRRFDAPFVPGWDCHGLPVEHQLFKELNISKSEIDQLEFRKKAFDYAMKYVDIQRSQFKRLGVLGDWDKPYLTLSKEYEAGIVRAFARLVEKGYIYKDKKPVNWCAKCETALAEAEVEYMDKTSPSIYVRFKLADESKGRGGSLSELRSTDSGKGDISFIIWTTTPWTLLANVAIALHPEFDYAVVSSSRDCFILAKELVDATMARIGIKDYKIIKEVKGAELEGLECEHPFIERMSRIVLADYVSREEGTGCVHTAPGHGQEDYLTGKRYSLPMVMPVDSKGRFDDTCGEFSGLNVYDANAGIVERLRRDGRLLLGEEVAHSYPHCWRCKCAIIFRATEQYFMDVDHLGLRKEMLKAIQSDVKWIPPVGRERISSMVENRPDWCLSRQRYWGVPIVAFHCEDCKEVLLDSKIIDHVAAIIEREGSNAWFTRDPRGLLPEDASCTKCKSKNLVKEMDIVDVWFESGVSHQVVLKRARSLKYPCQLYLEGSDQHRGWFQSALITAMAIDRKSPYRGVLTHGFVVDGEGKKMSKSLGNVISPGEVMKEYGADILRLWVASSDYTEDVRLSGEILTRLADAYRKIRNTFKYLLSNSYDFSPDRDRVEEGRLLEIDRWALSRLSSLVRRVTDNYENYMFHKVFRDVYNFCVKETSSIYLDVLKDRMYTYKKGSVERRSGQTVIYEILRSLLKIMAPIMVFTTDEAWDFLDFKDKKESVHLAAWPDLGICEGWSDEALDEKWARLLGIRELVLKEIEEKRKRSEIGSPLEAKVMLSCEEPDIRKLLEENRENLPYVFIVSQVELQDKNVSVVQSDAEYPVGIAIERAEGNKCERCWNYSTTVGCDSGHPTLCARCIKAIK